jgi:Ca-activated chloride channel homolog
MKLESPEYLYLLLLIPLLILFFFYAQKRKRDRLSKFGNIRLLEKLSLSHSKSKEYIRMLFIIGTVFFMILALSRPQFGTKLQTLQRKGVDVFIALDTSQSMLAEDIKPTRLQKAKHLLSNLIDQLKGDRIGIIAFAGDSFIQCPLTLDYGAAKLFLDILDTGTIPRPGTAIAGAIKKATNSFITRELKYKVLVLLTDGEDHEGEPVKAAEEAEKQGVVIHTIGFGSANGAPIPVKDQNGVVTGYKKDRSGNIIMSKLDETTLEKIALMTSGNYYRATTGEVEVKALADEIEGMEKKEHQSKKFAQYEERFQYPLVFSLILLCICTFLKEGRKIKGEWKGRFEA